MTYTNSFLDWLKDTRVSGDRIVLIEIMHNDKTYGLSDYPYFLGDLIYDDLIVEPVELEESFDNTTGVGDVIFLDDKRNVWIKESFTGDLCKIFLGDKSWGRDKFALIVLSTIKNIERSENNTYQINFDNADYRLDETVESNYINDQLIPFVLGNPFNCSPVLSNYGNQEYQFSSGEINSLVVRDAGLTPDSVNNNYTEGKITLGKLPVGQITGDIVESHSTLISVIDYLLGKSGVSDHTIKQINLQGQGDYKVGWYSKDTVSYREIISALIEPLGISMRRNNVGDHELISIDKSISVLTLNDDDLFSVGFLGFEEQKNKIEIGYAKNFEVQSEGSLVLVSENGLTEANKLRYGIEYKTLSKSITNAAIGQDTFLRIDTYLTKESQAKQELERLEKEYKDARKRWSLEVTIAAVGITIGDTVTVNHDDVKGDVVVISVKKNISGQQIDIEVIQ